MIASTPQAQGISTAKAPDLDLPARFMALGMICLILAALAFPFALPVLANGYGRPMLLAFVHLNTLGFIATIIVGASYQLVPVVLQTTLVSERLGRLSFWIHVLGLALFLPGLWLTWLPGIATGATLIFSGLLLYLTLIALTLWTAPHRDIVGWHIAGALTGLGGGIVFGFLLALNEGAGFLGSMTVRLLAAHITLMFGGWIAVMVSGVSYRLVGMFTLAEDRLWRRVAWLELALSMTGAWGLALGLALGADRILLLAGATFMASGQAFFALQLLHLYRVRLRRGFDIHIPFTLVAAAAGLTSSVLLAVSIGVGMSPGSRVWIAIVWLALMGLSETAIQGFLYKIATFLVWLHRYAPLAGRQKVPRLEELFGMRLSQMSWTLWTGGLALAVMGILAGNAITCLIAGVMAQLGLVAFIINVVRIAMHWEDFGVVSVRLISHVGQSDTQKEGENL